jgi:hypothetical protein
MIELLREKRLGKRIQTSRNNSGTPQFLLLSRPLAHGARRFTVIVRIVVDAHSDMSLFAHGELVDLVSVWSDGGRRAPAFRIVEYPTPAGCAAAYFPEANVLVPLDSTAGTSNTPTSKSVIIRLDRHDSKAAH